MVESWKEELDKKYEEVTSLGDVRLIDVANEIILEAIRKVDRLKTGRPRTWKIWLKKESDSAKGDTEDDNFEATELLIEKSVIKITTKHASRYIIPLDSIYYIEIDD